MLSSLQDPQHQSRHWDALLVVTRKPVMMMKVKMDTDKQGFDMYDPVE
jgi:hypothetical protein